MGHPGGGRTAISSRTLHCFHLLNVCMPSDSQLRKIFGSIAASHLLNFDEDIKPLAEVMTTATLEIYTYMVAELLPTPEKPHYTFNLRDISRVFQGVLQSQKD